MMTYRTLVRPVMEYSVEPRRSHFQVQQMALSVFPGTGKCTSAKARGIFLKMPPMKLRHQKLQAEWLTRAGPSFVDLISWQKKSLPPVAPQPTMIYSPLDKGFADVRQPLVLMQRYQGTLRSRSSERSP